MTKTRTIAHTLVTAAALMAVLFSCFSLAALPGNASIPEASAQSFSGSDNSHCEMSEIPAGASLEQALQRESRQLPVVSQQSLPTTCASFDRQRQSSWWDILPGSPSFSVASVEDDGSPKQPRAPSSRIA